MAEPVGPQGAELAGQQETQQGSRQGTELASQQGTEPAGRQGADLMAAGEDGSEARPGARHPWGKAPWRPFPAYLPYAGLAAIVALFVWWAHDYMAPGFTGFINDDAHYLGSAKALAEGKGYSLPWSNTYYPADRFPIGFPAFLALFLLIKGTFTEQVRWIQEAQIVLAAGFILVSFLYAYRYLRIPAWACLSGALLTVLCPLALWHAGMVLSDLPFGLIFGGAIWATHAYLRSNSPRHQVLAVVLTAAAILTRYAGVVLPACTLAVLVFRRRYREAAIYAIGVGLVLLPWVAWVLQHHAFGYASQIAHQGVATPTMRALSLAFSAAYMFFQGIPALFLQGVFLAKFPERTPIAFDDPVFLLVGLVLSAIFLAGLALSCTRPEHRFPALVVAATLALVLVWQVGFLNLGEFLTIRLLLPVLPIALTLCLAGWGWLAGRRSPATSTLYALALVGLLIAAALQGANLHDRWVRKLGPIILRDRKVIYGLLEEFDRQVPEGDRVATNMEPLFYLITGRPCWSLVPNPDYMAGLIQVKQIRYFVAVPVYVGGKELILESVKQVNRKYPGTIYTIENSAGQPTGVFRIDHEAFQKALAKRSG